MSDYASLINRLMKTNVTGGIKLGLKNVQDLDKLLGHPSQEFPSIHVAGTNGKGSVTTKIAAAYRASGKKVGLFTSPHISCFRERISIDGCMITEEQVCCHLNRLFSVCSQHDIKATFFELITMLAFLHFAEEKVDLAALETGLGGRLDATNIAKSIMSVITSISFDHTQILGDSIEAITKEKAGIIKVGMPVVIGPRVDKTIVAPIAFDHKSPFYQVTGTFEDYHAENCAIARLALENAKLKDCFIQEGLQALPPCRLETLAKSRLIKAGFSEPFPEAIIMDVAHNPDGITHLLKAVRRRYKKSPLRFIIGLSSNKDIQGFLEIIKDEGIAFHCIEGANERAATKQELVKILVDLGVEKHRIIDEPSIYDAIKNAVRLAGAENEIVVICGTFFIMAQAREALGIIEPRDPLDMNEK